MAKFKQHGCHRGQKLSFKMQNQLIGKILIEEYKNWSQLQLVVTEDEEKESKKFEN